MDVNLHLRSLDAVGTGFLTSVRSRDTKAVHDEVALENSQALTTALHDTPPARGDEVRRAAELVGDVNYPPPETIRMISHLLAIQMQPDGEIS